MDHGGWDVVGRGRGREWRATRGPLDPKAIPSHGVLRGRDQHFAVFVAAVIAAVIRVDDIALL